MTKSVNEMMHLELETWKKIAGYIAANNLLIAQQNKLLASLHEVKKEQNKLLSSQNSILEEKGEAARRIC